MMYRLAENVNMTFQTSHCQLDQAFTDYSLEKLMSTKCLYNVNTFTHKRFDAAMVL